MATPHGSLAGAAARRRLGSLACQLVQPTSVAEAALPPPGGAVNPELARRGVTEYSCFDIPAGATVDELMQQRGAQDIDPETAATVEPIFDMNADCIRNFDHDKFQRDGYWVWDKIWLPEAQEKLVAACHRAQKLVDMYTEGYKAFQKKFSPLVVKRAFTLAQNPGVFNWLLAGPYSMGLFGATPKRMKISWAISTMVVVIVQVVKRLPYPWRGIADAGVVAGLTYGSASILLLFLKALFGFGMPDCSAELPVVDKDANKAK